ncbi:DUF2180 family protein [Streptomyces violascens]|uniref:DUF2180 family protein n=1 Tax=Streptomyces violascens TaxID=67381 RepID=UPI0036A0F728
MYVLLVPLLLPPFLLVVLIGLAWWEDRVFPSAQRHDSDEERCLTPPSPDLNPTVIARPTKTRNVPVPLASTRPATARLLVRPPHIPPVLVTTTRCKDVALTHGQKSGNMDCYDCNQLGKTASALAVCWHCGAAICPTHIKASAEDVRRSAGMGLSTLRQTTRRLACPTCYDADHQR